MATSFLILFAVAVSLVFLLNGGKKQKTKLEPYQGPYAFGDARFGMTPEGVQKALPNLQIRRIKNWGPPQVLLNYAHVEKTIDMFGVEWSMSFGFDSDRRLGEVKIRTPLGTYKSVEDDMAQMFIAKGFEYESKGDGTCYEAWKKGYIQKLRRGDVSVMVSKVNTDYYGNEVYVEIVDTKMKNQRWSEEYERELRQKLASRSARGFEAVDVRSVVK